MDSTVRRDAAAYTAAQYEERIARLVDLVGTLETALLMQRQHERASGIRDADGLDALISRCHAVLSTERAHRTAETAGLTGEPTIEQRRRGV